MEAGAGRAGAEGLGREAAGALSAGAARELAREVEYRARELAQEALKFARHAGRRGLSPGDLSQALELRGVQPSFAFAGRDPGRFDRAAGHPDVVFLRDPVVAPGEEAGRALPRAPRESGLRSHWLAVGGAVPAIPENAPELRGEAAALRGRLAEGGAKTSAGAGGGGSRGGTEGAEGGLPVRHVLPEELHTYFSKASGIICGPESSERQVVLQSLAQDPGLHPLSPYFAQLVVEKLRRRETLADLGALSGLLGVVGAMTDNPDVELETYLHRLLPTVLTCLVGGALGGRGDDHWQLRDDAAGVLRRICSRLREVDGFYNTQSRIMKTLLTQGLLDPSKGLTSHYGAVKGLETFGHRAMHTLVLPHVQAYMELLEKALAGKDAAQCQEARRVRSALALALGRMMHAMLREEEATAARALRPMPRGAKRKRGNKAGKAVKAAGSAAPGAEGGVNGRAAITSEGGGGGEAGWKEDAQLQGECHMLLEIFGDLLVPFVPDPLLR